MVNERNDAVLRNPKRRRRRRARTTGIRWTEQTATWFAQHVISVVIVSAWFFAHIIGPTWFALERGNTSFVDTALGALLAYYFPRREDRKGL